MIIDAHTHLSNTDYGNVDLYLEQAEMAGIDRGVAVPGGMLDVRILTNYIIGRTSPSKEPPDNAYVESAIKTHSPRLVGLCCVDPHSTDAVQTLTESLKRGSRGLKLSPMSHQFSFASKAVAELVACCEQYEVPVYSHVLFSPGASTERFVSLARQFPRTNFILGHMGFGPADQDGLKAAVELDNLFLETSTGNYLHIEQAVKKAGPRKVIFGSEFPLSHPKAELERVLLLPISDDAKEMILGGNIFELLRLNEMWGAENQ